jgi:Domain of unknown function (DUF5063)
MLRAPMTFQQAHKATQEIASRPQTIYHLDMLKPNAAYGDFIPLVRLFCDSLVASESDRVVALESIRSALANLYAAAIKLPDVVDARYEDLPEDKTVLESRRKLVRERLDALLPKPLYWLIYEPFREPPEEAVCSSLANDLEEISDDLYPGLLLLDSQPEEWSADVYWDWKDSHYHWGDHAIDALSAIHKLLRDT